MNFYNFVAWLTFGVIAGWIASRLMEKDLGRVEVLPISVDFSY